VKVYIDLKYSLWPLKESVLYFRTYFEIRHYYLYLRYKVCF